MVFGLMKKIAGGAVREVQADYSGNKDFLEAVCAAAALIAAADGDIEDAEKREVVKRIEDHPVLGKIYKSQDIQTVADTMLKRATSVSGKLSLGRELDDVKGKPGGAQMGEDIYAVALDIAASDGEIEPQETEVLKKIASRLGVDASRFEF